MSSTTSELAVSGTVGDSSQVVRPEAEGLVVERLLGIGGRCAVWEVRRTKPVPAGCRWVTAGDAVPQRLALKVALESSRTVPAVHGMVSELEAMATLRHPHVVRAWGVVETSAGVGLLLDLYAAGSLAALCAGRGPLSVPEAVTVFTPVAEALAYLHRAGAAHGDVRCANILLAPDGHPALADLGDAQVLGMPAREAAPAEDIRQLAASLWQALTGEEPGEEAGRAPLRTLCAEAPAALADLLEAGLDTRASQRPRAEEFARELYACATAEPLDLRDHVNDHVLAEVPTVPASGYRPAGRQRSVRQLAGAAVLAASVLTGAGFWWTLEETAQPHAAEAEAAGYGGGARTQDTENTEGTEKVTAEEPAQHTDDLIAELTEEFLPWLAAERTAALRDPDPGANLTYVQADSSAEESERALLEYMVSEDLRYTGEPLRIESSSEPEEGPDGSIELQVRVTAETFEGEGTVTQQAVLTLQRTEESELLLGDIEVMD